MKSQIERSLQGTAHHDILHQTHQEHSQERAEKPAGVTEVIYSQIKDFCAERVRQSEGSEQIKQDGLEQENRELKKSPGMSPASSSISCSRHGCLHSNRLRSMGPVAAVF